MLKHYGKINNILAVLSAGGLLLGGLSIAVLPASAGQSGPPPAPLDPNIANPIYLPFITNKIIDLYISDIEVTQAVQNISVPVNLVAGRQTEARVYARAGHHEEIRPVHG